MTPGTRTSVSLSSSVANRPTRPSMIIDVVAPTAKIAESVERTIAPRTSW
jgi:hypothetical protein